MGQETQRRPLLERTLLMGAALLLVTAIVWTLWMAGIPVGNPAVFYFPVVILGTLYLNWQIAALAALTATVLSDFFLMEPLYQLGPVTLGEAIADVMVAVSNGLVIVVTAYLKRARATAERLAEENRQMYLQESERRRSAELFLGVLSHDLRTPLTVMKGRVQLARRRAQRDPAEAGAALDAVEEQVGRLIGALDALLDFQRLQQGAVALERTPVDLVALARSACQQAQTIHPDHTFRVQAAAPQILVSADVQRIETMLMNLLTNAAKYSPGDPRVEVSVTLCDGRAALTVQDHGMGIPAEEQERLFTPFYRTGAARQSGIGGTGLGLYTARQIMRLHSGTIRLTSAPGEGAAFTCIFPSGAALVQLAAQEPTPYSQPAG